MKLDKLKSHQKKIDALIKSVKRGDGQFSPLEKDLLLSYLRSMYDYVLNASDNESDTNLQKAKNTSRTTKTSKVDNAEKPPIQENRANDADQIVEVEEKEPEANMVEAPQAESIPSGSVNIPEEVQELFEIKQAVELSEKLSESPIKDLSKAMGINEKVFTIKELFGGSQELYNQTISSLNAFTNFGQAQEYLIKNVAVAHNWGTKNKKKKANNFIKLVKRRYK